MPEAGDPLKDAQAGERLIIRAPTWNLHNAAAREYLRHRHDRDRNRKRRNWQRSVVPLKNDSGYDRVRGNILGIEEALFVPGRGTLGPDNLLDNIAVVGKTPDATKHRGRFAILLEPIRDGQIGMACVDGVCYTKIEYEPGNNARSADIIDGEATKLKKTARGAARILSLGEAPFVDSALVVILGGEPWNDAGYNSMGTGVNITGANPVKVPIAVTSPAFVGDGWTYSTNTNLATCQRAGRYRWAFSLSAYGHPPKPTVDTSPDPDEVDSTPRGFAIWIEKNGSQIGAKAFFACETIAVTQSGYVFATEEFDVNDTVALMVQALDAGPSETSVLRTAAYELMPLA